MGVGGAESALNKHSENGEREGRIDRQIHRLSTALRAHENVNLTNVHHSTFKAFARLVY